MMATRQLSLGTKEQRAAESAARAKRLAQREHIQYKQTRIMRLFAIGSLSFIVAVTIYLILGVALVESAVAGTGNVQEGASAVRENKIDTLEGPLSERYFNIRW